MSLSVSMVAHPNASPDIRASDEWITAIHEIRSCFIDVIENGYVIKKGDPEGYAKAIYGLYRDICGKWNYVDADDKFISVSPPVVVDSYPYGLYDSYLSKLFRSKGVKLIFRYQDDDTSS